MKSISRSANLKQKASPEGLAKCLILLVGAPGFELGTLAPHATTGFMLNALICRQNRKRRG
jgi:hypothetical protein